MNIKGNLKSVLTALIRVTNLDLIDTSLAEAGANWVRNWFWGCATELPQPILLRNRSSLSTARPLTQSTMTYNNLPRPNMILWLYNERCLIANASFAQNARHPYIWVHVLRWLDSCCLQSSPMFPCQSIYVCVYRPDKLLLFVGREILIFVYYGVIVKLETYRIYGCAFSNSFI